MMKKSKKYLGIFMLAAAMVFPTGIYALAEEIPAATEMPEETGEKTTEELSSSELTTIGETEDDAVDIQEIETGSDTYLMERQSEVPEAEKSISPSPVEKSGFVTDEFENVYYYDPSTKEMIKGERYIRGHWYYFDESTGIMATGWTKHHNHQYYYNEDGWMLYGNQTIDGRTYTFDKVTGIMISGVERVEGGHWVYYGADGARATGWTEHHGNRYYYNEKGWMLYGSQTIDGKKYIFDTVTGVLITNVERVEGGHWVYYGADGARATGWTEHHGNRYYYNEKGWMLYGNQTIDGKKYVFDKVTGVLLRNVEKVEGGHWVYYGSDGVKVTGWAEHHGNRYYYNEKGWMLYGNQTIDGKKYYFDPVTGVMYKGEKVVSGHWVYFSEVDGAMAVGWTEHHGNRYYYNEKGWMLYGNQTIDGKEYTFDKVTGVLQYGFYEKDGKVYYRDIEGERLLGKQIIDGKTLLFDETTGELLTGLRVVDNETYYYVNKAPYVYTGEIYLNGHWRYFDETTGAMAIGWTEHHGHRYYYNDKGEMLYGTQNIDGKTYYFDTVTGIERDTLGWVQEGSSWAYYDGGYRKYSVSDLRSAFNWSSSAVAYQSLSGAPAGTSHVAWYGNYGFKNQRGNCYVMAATFCHMARLMGYEAYLVEGSVPMASGGMGPHGWCEIVMNGTTYVCDPDFTYETGRNGYFITYGTSGTWRYSNYRRVN